MNPAATTAIDTADWRMRVFAIYDEVRRQSTDDIVGAHDFWRRERDELFATHPATPLLPEDRPGFRGLPVAEYDPAWRFVAEIEPPAEPRTFEFETGTDGVVPFDLLGVARIDGVGSLDIWRLASYGGGLFVPVKDARAGKPNGTYGGGRYLIDTIKGSNLTDANALGGTVGGPGGGSVGATARIVLDFNFAYNPSCAYDPAWACPLAQPGDTVAVQIPVGESYPGDVH